MKDACAKASYGRSAWHQMFTITSLVFACPAKQEPNVQSDLHGISKSVLAFPEDRCLRAKSILLMLQKLKIWFK